MGSTIPSHRVKPCYKVLTTNNHLKHLNSVLGVEGSSFGGIMMPHGESQDYSKVTMLMLLLIPGAATNIGTWNVHEMRGTGRTNQIAAEMRIQLDGAQNQ